MSHNILLKTIKIYQKSYVNKMLSLLFGASCRFSPTCSQYTYEAISRYGTIKGISLGVRRVFKCHPFNKGGFDPVA